jgi:hypothetical protein
MSKRFGRNQKRRMREKVSELEQALKRDGALLHHALDQRRAIEQAMDRARRILGSNVALPPEVCGNHPYPLGGDFTASIHDPVPLLPATTGDATTSFRLERMHQLLSRIEEGGSFDERAIHFRVRLDSGHVGYAISRAAIERLSASELQQTILPMIAHELSRHLAAGLKGVRP